MAKYFRNIISENYKVRVILSFFVCLLVFSSCDDSTVTDDLIGQWKLEEMTYKGETTHPQNMYLRFHSNYVETHDFGDYNCLGHYVRTESIMTMKFYFSYRHGETPGNTDPNNPAHDLISYNFYDNGTPRTNEDIEKGINPVNIKFNIDTFNSSTLILSSDDGKWVFSKW